MRISLERISNLAHSYFVRSFQHVEFEYYTLYHGTRMALYFDEFLVCQVHPSSHDMGVCGCATATTPVSGENSSEMQVRSDR